MCSPEAHDCLSGRSAILLVATRSGQRHVVERCERAAQAGVKPGMSLAHARALLPIDGVIIEDHDQSRDERRLKSLANWAMRFTPVVAVDPPDGLLLDVTGCQRLHRGERRLLNTVANSIEWLGFAVRIAAASNAACAHAVARYAEPVGQPSHPDRFIVRTGDELKVLRDLPVWALRLEPETIDAVREVNITRIGELTRLPRHDLAARFGRLLLQRLDQAAGHAADAFDPQRVIETPRAERAFDGPVRQIEGVMMVVRELLHELCAMLQRAENGVRRLRIDFERIDAANLCESVSFSRPSRDAAHLWSLLRPRIEAVNMGFGIERIIITAPGVGRLPHQQAEHWAGGEADPASTAQAAGELIDTLSNRLGHERVSRAALVESHLPERAFRYQPAMTTASATPADAMSEVAADRPTTLHPRPESIEVTPAANDAPPGSLHWRGAEHRVITGIGPERISDEWWRGVGDAVSNDGELAARDYFRVQIEDGRWLWIYRDLRSDRWFVHGEWG